MPNELTTPWADREELRQLLLTARESCTRDFLLIALLGLNGLRASEAIGAAVPDLGASGGHRTLRVTRKGSKAGIVPLALPVVAAVDDFLEGREAGPLIARLNRAGAVAEPFLGISRQAVYDRVQKLAREAGVNPALSPHSLRRSFVTISLQDGVPLHLVQDAVGHSSPHTTMLYNRNRHNLDSNPTFKLAEGLLEGVS